MCQTRKEKVPTRFKDWIILKAFEDGWIEYPTSPCLVFSTEVEAKNYARHALGRSWRFEWRWCWDCVPFIRREWRVAFLERTPERMVLGDIVKDARKRQKRKQARKHLEQIGMIKPLVTPESLEKDSEVVCDFPIMCECNSTYCVRQMKVPSRLYTYVMNNGFIVRHKDCDIPPEEGERFVGAWHDFQIWQDSKGEGET